MILGNLLADFANPVANLLFIENSLQGSLQKLLQIVVQRMNSAIPLTKQYCLLIAGEGSVIRCDTPSSCPNNLFTRHQHWPSISFAERDAVLQKQFLELVALLMTARLISVTRLPTPKS